MKGMNFTYNISEIEEFLKTCPEGLMTKRKFVDLSALALGGKSQFLADALFRNLTCKPIMFLEIALIFFIWCVEVRDISRVFDDDNSGAWVDMEAYFLCI